MDSLSIGNGSGERSAIILFNKIAHIFGSNGIAEPSREYYRGINSIYFRFYFYFHSIEFQKRKIVGESTSTQVLRDLEISLRTNHIEWVKEFLDEENQGLDSLVDYLHFRLTMMRHEQRIQECREESTEEQSSIKNSTIASAGNNRGGEGGGGNSSDSKSNGFIRPSLDEMIDSPNLKRRSRHIAKLNMGASTDDIHVCIMCLRAIMNNKYGFNMVIQHREAINCIALSLIHKSLRTKALVLELLAAICLVKGGHEITLSAFDNLKTVCQESKRFQTLMEYFINYDLFNIDFMVACMQFINIVVHSVEDMNYRVHLQFELTALGLDDYLEKLRLTESEELHVQISAYLDNVFDVAALMEDSETKTAALERVQELEDDLGRAVDRLAEVERHFVMKLDEMESKLQQLQNERDELSQFKRQADEEVSTLRKVLKQNEMELKNRQNMLETKNLELQTLSQSLPKGATIDGAKGFNSIGLLTGNVVTKTNESNEQASLPPPIPPPPPASALAASTMAPPKPPPMFVPVPPVPPVPGYMPAPDGAMTIKRKYLTKYKLPTLNWVPLKPNQVSDAINMADIHVCLAYRLSISISLFSLFAIRFVARYSTSSTMKNCINKLIFSTSRSASRLVWAVL